jgi:hypothetical protein
VEREKAGLSFDLNDSLLLMLQSLEKLGKSFVPLEPEVQKGIFPYLLNDIRYLQS